MTGPDTATANDALQDEVRALLRAGLPVRIEQCGPGLLSLPGVRARAMDPQDPTSRARVLDAVVREQLDRLENAELAEAAKLLFGARTSTSGATLTARRQTAAAEAGYEVNHFRKRIEPKLLGLLAWQLRRESEDFAGRHAAAPALRAASAAPILPADVFAWEATEHQQAVATLWGAVYQSRAQLLAVSRLVSMDVAADALSWASSAALWRHALVLHAAAGYRAAYGAVLLHAAGELGPEGVAASAGWTPELTPAHELLLVACADPDAGLADFTARLHAAPGGVELADHWRRTLTGRPPRAGGHRPQGGPTA